MLPTEIQMGATACRRRRRLYNKEAVNEESAHEDKQDVPTADAMRDERSERSSSSNNFFLPPVVLGCTRPADRLVTTSIQQSSSTNLVSVMSIPSTATETRKRDSQSANTRDLPIAERKRMRVKTKSDRNLVRREILDDDQLYDGFGLLGMRAVDPKSDDILVKGMPNQMRHEFAKWCMTTSPDMCLVDGYTKARINRNMKRNSILAHFKQPGIPDELNY